MFGLNDTLHAIALRLVSVRIMDLSCVIVEALPNDAVSDARGIH